MAGIPGELLIGLEWALIGIAACLILARLILRLNLLGRRLIMSDYFILAAFVAGVGLNSFDLDLYKRKVYQPEYDYTMTKYSAPEAEETAVFKLIYIEYFPFYFEQYFNKASLLALYYEIFPRELRKLRISLLCLTLYCLVSFTITMFMVLFYCPMECHWDLESPCPDKCSTVSDNLGWALHFTSDICIFLLPLIYITRTKMSLTQKVSAGVTFCLGVVNLAVTLARWFVVQAVFTQIPFITNGEALAMADGHTGLIIALLLSLRPYLCVWQGADLSTRLQEVTQISRTGSKHGGSSVQASVSQGSSA